MQAGRCSTLKLPELIPHCKLLNILHLIGTMDGFYINLLSSDNHSLDWDENNEIVSPPEEQQPPFEELTLTVRPNQKRSINFSEKEDELLVLAWLNISMNVVQGNDQSRSTY